MNKESEAINNLLAWLLQNPTPTSASSGERSTQGTNLGDSGTANLQFNELDPLDSEDLKALPVDLTESNPFYFPEISSFRPGDIPAVQDRFHTLLKRRLRTEIERNPPLFPWETEVYDYESESPDLATPALVPANPWVTHLRNLSLPALMPEAVLSQLFDRCQDLVQSSLREGERLVQAVEFLFPQHPRALNEVSNGVLKWAHVRGKGDESPMSLPSGLPSNYEAATQPQKMTISVLAAYEIIKSLTLGVSPNRPRAAREWTTPVGSLLLTAEYPKAGRLRIQSQLPCSGSLRFQGVEAQATAQRSNPGSLSVELFDLPLNQVYPLEIQLTGSNQPPLVFAVHPTTDEE